MSVFLLDIGGEIMRRSLTLRQLKKRNRAQVIDALGDLNKYYAGLKLGHSPSRQEAIDYFMTHGGPEAWYKRHRNSHSR